MSEWKKTTIKQSSYLKGRIGWQGLKASEFTDIGPYLVTGTDFSNGKIIWDTCYHVNERRYKEAKYIQLKNHDLLITKDGTIGKIAYVLRCPQQAVLNSGIFLLRCQNGSYIQRFLYHVLTSEIFDKFLANNLNGSTINHLYQYVFENFEFHFPTLPHQKKIARILTTVDNIIEKTEAAIAKYKVIKQGMMHDLFTRGIDVKTGKLRPAFDDAPELYKESELGMIPKEWEVKPLEKFTSQIGDGIHTTPKYTTNTDFYFINGNNLTNGEIIISDSTLCVDENEYKKHCIELDNRTILYSINGTIGNVALFKGEKVILGKSAAYIVCNNTINWQYIYLFLQTESINKFYENEMTGSTIKNLSLASIRKTPITYPVKGIEQNKIADRINVISFKLQKEECFLTKYKKFKQGLMQDLLTGNKEVTPDAEDFDSEQRTVDSG